MRMVTVARIFAVLLTKCDWCTNFIEASNLDGSHFGFTENEIENRLIIIFHSNGIKYVQNVLATNRLFSCVRVFFFLSKNVNSHDDAAQKMVFNLVVKIGSNCTPNSI